MLTVFGAVILVSLLGMVVTTGDQVTQKIEMQNAVDAAALSGGVWIARGLNVTSGLNLIQTQLMAGAIVLRGLNATFSELDRVLGWWVGALKLCAPWNPFCAALLSINKLQHSLLKGLKPVVRFWAELLAGCPPGRVGLFWLIGKALEWVNTLVHDICVIVGMIETWDLAKISSPEKILFVPGPLLNGQLKLTMPTEKRSTSYHCDPMERGSLQRLHRGYHALAGYRIGEGPFEVGRKRFRSWVWWVAGLPPWGIWIYDRKIQAEKDAVCRGGRCGSWRPRPYVLNDADQGLHFLAIARRAHQRSFFDSRSLKEPSTLYTYAQVEIYNAVNRTEADTYTQDWRVRLAPASLISSPLSSEEGLREGFVLDDFVSGFVGTEVMGSGFLQEVGNH